MNLQQLRYVREVARNGLSVSRAAKTLHTSQPGVSQQIRLLEAELGVNIFSREKNRLSGLTSHGAVIVERLNSALGDIDHVCAYARTLRTDEKSDLVVITSHTQARYVLPKVLEAFSKEHPTVQVDVKHGAPGDIMAALLSRTAAIGIIAGEIPKSRDVLALPYAKYERIVVVPKGHPLLKQKHPTLKTIAAHPLIGYEHSISAREAIIAAFRKAGATPQMILNAIDADVIKACVESGLGIAVLPAIAFDPKRDTKLRRLRAGDLFPPSGATIAIHRKRVLHSHEYDFIQLLAPQWTRRKIENLLSSSGN